MTQTFDIAVIGATGTVGETIVQLLEEREFPVGQLHLLASIESAGSSVPYKGKNVRVREVADFDFKLVRLAFFAGGDAATRSFAGRAHEAGCAVIDLSGSLPPDESPRVVPEINAQVMAGLSKPVRVSCPSPAATAVALVVKPLLALLQLNRINVTACLAISTQGRAAIVELARQTTELLNVRPLEPQFFDRQVAFNLLAQVGKVDEQGHALLEKRLVSELRQLLELPTLKVSATCIQAPVFFGDSFSVALDTSAAVDLAAVSAALDAADGLEWVESDDYPTAVGDAVGQDEVYVGRVRGGIDDSTAVNLWIASDNVRKGAALNAVQLAELLIKHYL